METERQPPTACLFTLRHKTHNPILHSIPSLFTITTMEQFLYTTPLETVDENFQARHRPPSQQFKTLQSFPGVEPSLSANHNINNLVPQFADGTVQMGDLDTMMQSSVMEQPMRPMFGRRIMPQPSLSMNHATTSQGIKFNPGTSSFVREHQVPVENQPQHPSGAAQPPARKRAPKASTMSAKKWKHAEGRIRQLFVDEESSIRDLMDTVNKEFGFTAT